MMSGRLAAISLYIWPEDAKSDSPPIAATSKTYMARMSQRSVWNGYSGVRERCYLLRKLTKGKGLPELGSYRVMDAQSLLVGHAPCL